MDGWRDRRMETWEDVRRLKKGRMKGWMQKEG